MRNSVREWETANGRLMTLLAEAKLDMAILTELRREFCGLLRTRRAGRGQLSCCASDGVKRRMHAGGRVN
ncbi:MAG: hypothetical protein JWP07_3983 [Pseudonocardiales bacterium]|nr:hypothetical protein [Pseudonocardiales bacterium]